MRPIVDPHLSDERTGAVADPDASGHRGQPVDAGEAESREGDCEPAAAGQDEDDDREPAQEPAAGRPRHAGPPSRPAQTGDLLHAEAPSAQFVKGAPPRWLKREPLSDANALSTTAPNASAAPLVVSARIAKPGSWVPWRTFAKCPQFRTVHELQSATFSR